MCRVLRIQIRRVAEEGFASKERCGIFFPEHIHPTFALRGHLVARYHPIDEAEALRLTRVDFLAGNDPFK
jgi:hypothetical protein